MQNKVKNGAVKKDSEKVRHTYAIITSLQDASIRALGSRTSHIEWSLELYVISLMSKPSWPCDTSSHFKE